jgi:hypothetical protein
MAQHTQPEDTSVTLASSDEPSAQHITAPIAEQDTHNQLAKQHFLYRRHPAAVAHECACRLLSHIPAQRLWTHLSACLVACVQGFRS